MKVIARNSVISVIIMLIICVFLALGQSLATADERFEKAKVIKIGVLGPLHQEGGEADANASKLAVEGINAAGGIMGKKIELIIRDDEMNSSVAIEALKKLVYEDKVVAVCGGFASGIGVSLMEHLQTLKIPYINSGAGSNLMPENVAKNYEKYKYYFMLMHNVLYHNPVSLGFAREILKKQPNIKKVALLSEQATWCKDFEPYMKENLPKIGMEIVYSGYFDIKTQDFLPIFSTVKATGAEYIFTNSALTPGQFVTKGWFEAKAPPIGAHNTDGQSSDYWKKTQGMCDREVMFFIGGMNIPITPKTQPFYKKYMERYKYSPAFPGYFTYDAVYVIAEALRRAKSFDPDELVRAIEETKYIGVTGLIEFSKKDHDVLKGPGRPTNYYTQWQNGKQVLLYTLYPKPEYPIGKFMYPTWIKK